MVSYKHKRVHKVLPGLSLLQKLVVRLTDHLDMAMIVDWALNQKQKNPKIAPGSVIFI